jgi:hypothetical protein
MVEKCIIIRNKPESSEVDVFGVYSRREDQGGLEIIYTYKAVNRNGPVNGYFCFRSFK